MKRSAIKRKAALVGRKDLLRKPSERRCGRCGEPFTVRYPSNPRRYCSPTCAREAVSVALRGPRPDHRTRKKIRCAHCGEEFERTISRLMPGNNYCSRTCFNADAPARHAAAKVASAAPTPERRGRQNPNFRHGRRSGERDRAGERRWYAAPGRACAHPQCDGECGELIQHHIVYRQHVRAAGGDMWDVRNRLTLGNRCHSSHHRRGTYIVPVTALPDAAFEFAAELLGHGRAYEYLRRRYRGTDPRLEVLRG